MILTDFHTHTTFSDGKNTPEEMVLAAIAKGMTAIGFSDHSPVFFDPEPNMQPGAVPAYRAEIQRLKEKYRGQIHILLGIEQDYCTPEPPVDYDYVIGSVHYIQAGSSYIAVDDTPELLRQGVQQHFGGDFYAFSDAYWDTVSQVVEKTGCDLIGHLDLIRKFNRNGEFFDETSPRYLDAAKAAIDKLLRTGKPFEINTGAISRGYQDTPYPAQPLLDYILLHGGKCILSSDSHKADTLCFGFAELSRFAAET